MKPNNSSISSSDAVPVAAIAAIVICLGFEACVAVQRDRLTGAINATVLMKKARLADPVLREDVLIFGDSRVFSISPEEVARALGGQPRVANYSWAFSGIEMYDLALRAYLHYKPPPRLILANLMPDYVALPEAKMRVRPVREHGIRVFTMIPAAPLVQELVADRSWGLLWDYFAYRCAPPSVRYRDSIITLATATLRDRRLPSRGPEEIRVLRSMKESGCFLLYDQGQPLPDAAERFAEEYGPVGVYSPAILGDFERFLEHAAEADIEVLLLNPPLHEELYRRYESIGVLAQYRSRIAELVKKHANFQVIKPELQEYPNHTFGDIGHLNREGDTLFRAFYSRRLREYASRFGQPW